MDLAYYGYSQKSEDSNIERKNYKNQQVKIIKLSVSYKSTASHDTYQSNFYFFSLSPLQRLANVHKRRAFNLMKPVASL